MSKLIKDLANNRKVIFDTGNFDDWCVYVVEGNGTKKAPFDIEYFSDLKQLSSNYLNDKIYDDFVHIYDKTTSTIDSDVIKLIDDIVTTYNIEDQAIIEQWFSVLYARMVAEENKQFAVLKKRIKRLGMHQTLKLNFLPQVAANFSKGKKWRELDTVMHALGF